MSCDACKCVIGGNYFLENGTCADCGEVFSPVGEYIGMSGGYHQFRLHPRVPCPGCGELRYYSLVPCKELDVTEEFNVMFHRKDSHWIGGSNAER